MRKDNDITTDWQLFINGKNYNDRLDPPFYRTININNSMYIGDQWRGVKANGNPTPVFNIFKRIINHQIASIASSDTKMQIVSEEADDTKMIGDVQVDNLTEILTGHFDRIWENTKMSYKLRELLLDGALSGDYCIYSCWNEMVGTKTYRGIDKQKKPVEIMGQIENEIIDSVNVFFGNPNDRRVNENGRPIQPYIVIAFRQMTADLKEEAKRNGISKQEIEKITPDTDNDKQAGERGDVELENGKDESGKTTAILKLWKKDGKIYARKSTKLCVIRKEWDTKRTLYPVAWGNWDVIKNSYHGQAVGTGLVPNQLFINKQFAMSMISLMNNAYPKVVYDKTRIGKWSNAVGSSFGVEGPIDGVAQQIEPGMMSPQIMQFIDATIQYTKEMLGASDAGMGNVNPTNTSAIIAVQQASAIPLETIKMNLYQFIEDLGYIWLDTMIAHYNERQITVDVLGEKQTITLDFSKLRELNLKLKIDVGASSYWSQISSIQTLDNLLQQDRISFLNYLRGLPVGILNRREELISIEEEKEAMAEQQMLMEQQAAMAQQMPQQSAGVPYEIVEQIIQSMPPELQQAAIDYITEAEGGMQGEM